MKTAAQIADEVLAKVAADAPKALPTFKSSPKGGFGLPRVKDKEESSRFKSSLRKATEKNIHATTAG